MIIVTCRRTCAFKETDGRSLVVERTWSASHTLKPREISCSSRTTKTLSPGGSRVNGGCTLSRPREEHRALGSSGYSGSRFFLLSAPSRRRISSGYLRISSTVTDAGQRRPFTVFPSQSGSSTLVTKSGLMVREPASDVNVFVLKSLTRFFSQTASWRLCGQITRHGVSSRSGTTRREWLRG